MNYNNGISFIYYTCMNIGIAFVRNVYKTYILYMNIGIFCVLNIIYMMYV